MRALLRRLPRRSFGERRAVSGAHHTAAASQQDRISSIPDAGSATSRHPQTGGWGRNLLAGVGLALTLVGSVIVLLPFFTRASGFVSAPGIVFLGVGVLLVVMSAFFESTRGVGILPGWRVSFGKGEQDEATQLTRDDDHDPRLEADPTERRR